MSSSSFSSSSALSSSSSSKTSSSFSSSFSTPQEGILKHRTHRQLTYLELSKYFGIPLDQAAALLNVHPTQLTRSCRAVGIDKWPFQEIKEVTAIRRREELAAIAPPEETKLGSTVVEETVEFGAQNTAKLFPIGVKLAKFKGAKSQYKITNVRIMPPMKPMV